MEKKPKVAVLGLGLLGSAIARRLLARNWAVVGWNRHPERTRPLVDLGLEKADSPAAALTAADLGLLLLSDYPALEETLWRSRPAPEFSGTLLVQMGTIAPEESRRLAERLAEAGGDYLEAPVLGSLPEASAGKLMVMAGGEPELFARALPVLQALSQDPRRVGPVGSGAALKLAMNQLIAGLTATFALSLGLVRAEGLAVEDFLEILRGSALYAPTFDKKLDKYLARDYGSANFPLAHLLKDVRLFRQVAESRHLDTALPAAVEAACIRAIRQGHEASDYAVLYEAIHPAD